MTISVELPWWSDEVLRRVSQKYGVSVEHVLAVAVLVVEWCPEGEFRARSEHAEQRGIGVFG